MWKLSILAMVALIGYAGTKYYTSQKNESEDQILLQNIEALSDSENETKYIRQDGNCVYEFTGKAGGKIGLYAAGVKIAELTIGADAKPPILSKEKPTAQQVGDKCVHQDIARNFHLCDKKSLNTSSVPQFRLVNGKQGTELLPLIAI